MASLLQSERVLYLVQGEKKVRAPLSQLYFCRYCSELRSLECVSHEVCANCFDCPGCMHTLSTRATSISTQLPDDPAKTTMKKAYYLACGFCRWTSRDVGMADKSVGECANCFDCPGCMHTLSTRATSISTQLPDDPAKTTMKKAYYLACGFCRWTSRDVGMADKSVASGGWQEPENPHTQRMNKLIEYYQQLAQKEKVERDRKKLARRRNYMPLAFSDKYSLGTRLQRPRAGASISTLAGLSLREGEDQKEVKIEPAQAVAEVEPLPEDYYTRPVNLTEVTTLQQRLLQPDLQPVSASQLYPRHKHLLIKRSLRCRKCEHNLSKPEFNPTSIKFKIQLVAVNYIPEVRIMSIPNLRYMKESQVLLTLTNPVENLTHVTLLECDEGDPDNINSTAKVVVPPKELILAGKDAAAEYDELAEPQDFQDDPDIVAFRKANKVGIFIKVTPQREEGEVTVCFKMKHDFKNLAAPIRPVEEGDQGTEVIWLTQHVELSFGPLLP
ncbi:dynactin 4, isoform CRA_d [Mus musculus]|nr:dynactin 4, isoform CRA_d [Mus musculus]